MTTLLFHICVGKKVIDTVVSQNKLVKIIHDLLNSLLSTQLVV